MLVRDLHWGGFCNPLNLNHLSEDVHNQQQFRRVSTASRHRRKLWQLIYVPLKSLTEVKCKSQVMNSHRNTRVDEWVEWGWHKHDVEWMIITKDNRRQGDNKMQGLVNQIRLVYLCHEFYLRLINLSSTRKTKSVSSLTQLPPTHTCTVLPFGDTDAFTL